MVTTSSQLNTELCRNCGNPLNAHHVAMVNGVAVAMGQVLNKWENCSRSSHSMFPGSADKFPVKMELKEGIPTHTSGS